MIVGLYSSFFVCLSLLSLSMLLYRVDVVTGDDAAVDIGAVVLCICLCKPTQN